MPMTDREIVAALAKKMDIVINKATYDENGNLINLDLSELKLTQLPLEIGQLTNLQRLDLSGNQLSQVPVELGQLSNLQELSLSNNQLSQVPVELGQLSNLQGLSLDNNQLSQVPVELGQLSNLQVLRLEDNPPLRTPPPEIVLRRTADMLTFLRELHEKSIIRYEAKLLLVGEGGTGKSSLLRALRHQVFDPSLSTTHGIEVDILKLSHPHEAHPEITLNTWDFGGQQIYHATHQFFLTRRSIYVVVWNARLGVEQGRLHYWLETIKLLAPDAPILLVATHIDERAPDLNYQAYKDAYPQLVGHLSVSNAEGRGIADLKAALVGQAMQLPLMGQRWPTKWLQVEALLQNCLEHHINADAYVQICATCGAEEDLAKGTLGKYLHDLGKILYFMDDYVLSNLVVLKPNWVTKAISRVLTDEKTRNAHGILPHSEMPRIWAADEEGHSYPPYLYPVFLRLMERFYLSYQIEADLPGDYSTRSLIPQLLPYQPPITLPPWPKIPARGQTQVEMVYRFGFVPAGIMSWFIVRTHRYTKNQHWREGVLLTYQDHEARVELNEMKRELRLLVWGVQPHNFFTILMNTVDVILGLFPGLTVRREIPCICHWERGVEEPCPHFYRYEELVRRMEAKRYLVECPETFAEVSVPTLLYGIHTSTDQQVMADIQQGQREIQQRLKELQKLDIIVEKLNQQSELIGRNFTRQWNLEMKKIEAECPNIFYLLPGSESKFNPKNWVSQEYLLCLMCQYPSTPHQVGEGYTLRKAEDWWVIVSPWLNHLVTFLRFAVPMGKAIDTVYDPEMVKRFQAHIDLLGEITKDIPELPSLDTLKPVATQTRFVERQQAVGPALRALHSFLKEADPNEKWGGLHKILTPDGNILWLCDEHRKEYEAQPLHKESYSNVQKP